MTVPDDGVFIKRQFDRPAKVSRLKGVARKTKRSVDPGALKGLFFIAVDQVENWAIEMRKSSGSLTVALSRLIKTRSGW